MSLDTLRTLQVPMPGGRTVPLSQFATFEYGQEYPLVWRRDRVPTLTVRADVVPGVLPDEVVSALDAKIAELNAELPKGYRVAVGGIAEESADLAGVGVRRRAADALPDAHRADVPAAELQAAVRDPRGAAAGLIGVVAALLVFQRPLGFVAILGILSLLGMIAKNAVILVVQIETTCAEGMNVWDAVIAAASSRLRPHDADRAVDGARPDPDRADGVLGPDGVRHHGRPAGRHAADAGLPADALHHRVPRQARRTGARPAPPRRGGMTSTELRDYATVVAATVALLVFIFNVVSQSRNRRIENLTRFNQAHLRLFAESTYLSLHLPAFEADTVVRDGASVEMERRFHLMLLEIERLAILANNQAVPRHTQVYMFGFYAPKILRLMTEAERQSMFWELAVGYLEGIAADIERYGRLTRSERTAFWR